MRMSRPRLSSLPGMHADQDMQLVQLPCTYDQGCICKQSLDTFLFLRAYQMARLGWYLACVLSENWSCTQAGAREKIEHERERKVQVSCLSDLHLYTCMTLDHDCMHDALTTLVGGAGLMPVRPAPIPDSWPHGCMHARAENRGVSCMSDTCISLSFLSLFFEIPALKKFPL